MIMMVAIAFLVTWSPFYFVVLLFIFVYLTYFTLGQKASKVDTYQYVYDAIRIPSDTWVYAVYERETLFLDKKVWPSYNLEV